ncbi:MAG: metallophosphoesterase family protein [Kiritimatiellae bacterium]|nr:metallophosphoesterase family protein [Kiritimatiellia bacterium]
MRRALSGPRSILALSLFGLSLAADAAPRNRILKGPYLQNPKPAGITIMWETKFAASSRVDFGPTDGYGSSVEDTTEVNVHEMAITGLQADTLYHYRVASGSTASADYTFHTAAPDGASFRFVAYGDCRTYPTDHAQVVDAILQNSPAIVLNTGDLVNNGTLYEEWAPEFFDPAFPLMSTTPMFPALGNHENNSQWYYDFFSVPAQESGSSTEAWYSFNYGCAHFIVLDSCQDFSPGSSQYQWLLADLDSPEAVNAAWRIVVFHHPAYSSAPHGGDFEVQTNLVPLFEAHNVQLVFNGHDHVYERSYKDGVSYIVTGGGGAPLYSVGVTPNPYSISAESGFHHCVIDATPATLNIWAVRNDLTVIDSVTILSGDETHDVAVTAVEAPATVAQGQTAAIAVHVVNEGTFAETFSVVLQNLTEETAYTQQVALACGASAVVDFDWQTGGTTPLGDHLFRADAGPVAGETDTDDNIRAATVAVVEAGPVVDLAEQDLPEQGTVQNDCTATHASDDICETLTEEPGKGKPDNRYSRLTHKWTIRVTGGSVVTLGVEAYKSGAGEDDFVFAYSTDDNLYTDLLTVTKAADDDQPQTAALPAGLSGLVYIMVADTDRTPENQSLEAIHIDHLFIRSDP